MKSVLSLSLMFLLLHLLQFSSANSFQDSASSPAGALEAPPPPAGHAVLNLLMAHRKLYLQSPNPKNPAASVKSNVKDSNAQVRRRAPSGHSPGGGNASPDKPPAK